MFIEPIATIHTPFSEKFAIPRQASVVREAVGQIHFNEAYRQADCLNGLDTHSHYWLIWGFHQHVDKPKSLTVRPPRLGGNKRLGVFATRSPFRPNNLGLSIVKREQIDDDNFILSVSGVDMLSGSPIYDIKPYIPYADHCPQATSQWADNAPTPVFTVTFEPEVERLLADYDRARGTRLYALVKALLTYDARPAYKANKSVDNKRYATRLYDVDIAWQIVGDTVSVVSARAVVT